MEEAIEPTCPNAWLAASHASSPRLAATVTSLSETDLNQRSKTGEWSIVQVLSDLGSAAEISTGLLQRGIAGDGAGPAREDLEPVWSDGGSLQGFPEEISDPTTGPSPGPRHVALETYLDRHIDGPCAPVLRAVREGWWPLDGAQHALALGALAWQVVRTQAFRSFDEQVGRQVFPALWLRRQWICARTAGAAAVGRGALEVFLDCPTDGSRPFRGR